MKKFQLRGAIAFSIFCLVFAVVSTCKLIYLAKESNKVIAVVGKVKLTQKDLESRIQDSLKNTEFTNLVNQSMIDQQFLKENGKVTEKEKREQLPFVSLIFHDNKTLGNRERENFIENYIKIKFLHDKLLPISEEDLQFFLEEEKELLGEAIVKLQIISGSPNELAFIRKRIENSKDSRKSIEEETIDVAKEEQFSMFNDYALDFSNAKIGDVFYSQGEQEKFIENESSRDGTDKLIVVDGIQKLGNKSLASNNIQKKAEAIYFSKKYYELRMELLNELKKTYLVQKY